MKLFPEVFSFSKTILLLKIIRTPSYEIPKFIRHFLLLSFYSDLTLKSLVYFMFVRVFHVRGQDEIEEIRIRLPEKDKRHPRTLVYSIKRWTTYLRNNQKSKTIKLKKLLLNGTTKMSILENSLNHQRNFLST